MKTKLLYGLVWTLWCPLAWLPLGVLYGVADLLYYPLYYCIRYRRKIVRRNLVGSFPEKSRSEIVTIEKQFYHFFCDYVVETLKLRHMNREQMMKRMTFDGVDTLVEAMAENRHSLCFVYLGHYGNWEWIASLPYWTPKDVRCAQIYHPLRNKAMDKLFLNLRNQFGGECIAMKVTLRRMIELKRAKEKTVVGFISDQLPKWSSIHHFTPFLNRETAVFTGTETMGKKLQAAFFYAVVTRPKRGYYHCSFRPLTLDGISMPDFDITDLYAQQLEAMIKETPHLWLWTHNRWKRTKEEYDRRNAK